MELREHDGAPGDHARLAVELSLRLLALAGGSWTEVMVGLHEFRVRHLSDAPHTQP